MPVFLMRRAGARQALESDVAAQALLPRWRRVSGVAELRSAVSHLLYGTTASSSSSSGGAGGRDPAKGAASSCRALEPLLWLPMPYDAFPITGPFVARELAAGNVWLLTAPAPGSGGAGAEGKQEHHQEEEVVGVMLLTYFEMLNRISAGEGSCMHSRAFAYVCFDLSFGSVLGKVCSACTRVASIVQFCVCPSACVRHPCT